MEVGIDISKLKFDVVLLNDEGKQKHKAFSNDNKGFETFKEWLNSLEALTAYCCMEATGRHGEELALFLSQNALNISVINPTRIKAFARSEGVRVKTDKIDAGIITRFCKAPFQQRRATGSSILRPKMKISYIVLIRRKVKR